MATVPTAPILLDLSRFTAAGYGNLYGPSAIGLQPGQLVAVCDQGSDTLAAQVLEVHGDHATLCIAWDQVLRLA